VVPKVQRRVVGLALIRAAVDAVTTLGLGLVLVLGHIDYYPRVGFDPASLFGPDSPYPIDLNTADPWAVRETHPGPFGSPRGAMHCFDAHMHPGAAAGVGPPFPPSQAIRCRQFSPR